MTRLIDADELEQKFANLEATALNYIGKLNERQDPEEHERWVMWTAILNERTAYKYELIDAPVVDAIPVEWIKKYAEEHRSCVQEFRYMLVEWAERKDNGQTD